MGAVGGGGDSDHFADVSEMVSAGGAPPLVSASAAARAAASAASLARRLGLPAMRVTAYQNFSSGVKGRFAFLPPPHGGGKYIYATASPPPPLFKGGGGAGGANFGAPGLEPHKVHYVKIHANPLISFASWVLAIRHHFLFSVWRRLSPDQRQLSDFVAFLL